MWDGLIWSPSSALCTSCANYTNTPMNIESSESLLSLKNRNFFVVIAVVLSWSASVEAGGRWVDAQGQSCVDACKTAKRESGDKSRQYAVPIGGRRQYYVCAGHIVGTPTKDERGGSNEG